MSNVTTTQFPPMPAHLAKRQVPVEQETFVIPGGAQPQRISIKDNRFTLVSRDGEEIPIQTLFLDVVIVGGNPHMSRLYYATKFDPSRSEYVPPDCWSDNGVGPSTNAGSPQNLRCDATCKWAMWNSAPTMDGKGGKPACQSAKKLAVIVDEKLYQLKVTPGAFGNWKAYTSFLRSAGGQPLQPTDVVTRIEFESQGVLKFRPMAYIDEKVALLQEQFWAGGAQHSEYAEVLGLDDRPIASLDQPQVAQNREPVQSAPINYSDPAAGVEKQDAAPRRGRPKKDEAPSQGFPEQRGFDAPETPSRNPPAPPPHVRSALDDAFAMPMEGFRK